MGACISKEEDRTPPRDARHGYPGELRHPPAQANPPPHATHMHVPGHMPLPLHFLHHYHQQYHAQHPHARPHAPAPGPSHPPPSMTEARTLSNNATLHSDSVRLAKHPDLPKTYHLVFTFDAVHDCTIAVRVCCRETGVKEGDVKFVPAADGVDVVPFADEKVSQGTAVQHRTAAIDFTRYPAPAGNDAWMVVVQIVCNADAAAPQQLHMSYLEVDLEEETASVAQQRLQVGREVFQLEAIFGAAVEAAPEDAEGAVKGAVADHLAEDRLCVVCLTDARDTIVMPCRHQCLCHECGEDLIRQTNKCPMCRGPIHSLLKTRRQSPPPVPAVAPSTSEGVAASDPAAAAGGH
eukprot:TRINITY_DN13723_c0_g1_i1.p1 TRINITY_DN13723_c0_g1~~TRINITY_DN13723_c0_g1_i1.p1  ORF type:complete len:350 (+),score=100.52 TRINITY_DN13723_c0_g1_i1:139-1188(+)